MARDGSLGHRRQPLRGEFASALEAEARAHDVGEAISEPRLEDWADLRWVQEQMGHASIEQTAGTYGHCQPERHEAVAARLDRYLTV